MEKSSFKHLIAVSVEVSLHGNAHGNLLNSSTIVNINLFSECFDFGNGPLKSMERRSNGCVALIKVPGVGLKNFGFSAQHASQDLHTDSTSFTEYGRFLILTW